MMEEVSKKRYFRHNERVLHDLKAGDLVEIEKFPYSHWGIYVGDGKIVHLGADDLDLRVHLVILFKIFGMLFNKAKVRKEDFWIVVGRHRANIRNHDDELGTPLSVDEILKRANESIAYTGYNVFYSNCEHFATWCRYGNQNSKQVKQVMAVLFLFSCICLLAVMEMDYSNYTGTLISIIYKERYIFALISLCIVLYTPVYYFQNKFWTIDYRKHSNYEPSPVAIAENVEVSEENQSDIKPEVPLTTEGDIQLLIQSPAVDDEKDGNKFNINLASTATIAEDLRGPDFPDCIQLLPQSTAVDDEQIENKPNINLSSTVTIAEDLTGSDFIQLLPQSTAVDDEQVENKPKINLSSTGTIAEDLRRPDFTQSLQQSTAVDDEQVENKLNINSSSTVTMAEDTNAQYFIKWLPTLMAVNNGHVENRPNINLSSTAIMSDDLMDFNKAPVYGDIDIRLEKNKRKRLRELMFQAKCHFCQNSNVNCLQMASSPPRNICGKCAFLIDQLKKKETLFLKNCFVNKKNLVVIFFKNKL